MVTAVAVEPAAVEFAPLPMPTDFDRAFDANDKPHAQLLEQRKQRFVGKSAISGQPDAPPLDGLKDQLEGPFDDGPFIPMHPALEHRLVVSAPVNRDSAPPDDQRNNEQVLFVFSRPIDGDANFAVRRHLAERLMSNAFGQPFWRQPLIVEQPREPFAGGLLVALRARELRLAAGLFVKNRRDEDRQRLELMRVCPGQGFFDIVMDACQVRVSFHGRRRLSQVR